MIENHSFDSRQTNLEKQLRLAGMTDEKEIHELSEYIVGLEYKLDKLNDMINILSQPKDNWVPDYKIHMVQPYIVYSGEPTDHCPMCEAVALPDKDQPQPGTHAYSIVYRCGSRVDAAYNSDEFHFYQSNECKGIE
jgi:hypothetical protein